MKKIFLILTIAILLFGCVKTDEVTENESAAQLDPQSQKEIEYGYYSSPLFLAYYPKDWIIDDQISYQGVFMFIAPQEDQDDMVSEEFIIEIWNGNQSSAEDFEDYERVLMNENDSILGKQEVSWKDRDAFVIEYESNLGIDTARESVPITMYYKTIFFRNGNWIYRLQYSVEKGKLERYAPIMETMLDKFVIGSG